MTCHIFYYVYFWITWVLIYCNPSPISAQFCISCRNQSFHMRCKLNDWFLYECNTVLKWVKPHLLPTIKKKKFNILFLTSHPRKLLQNWRYIKSFLYNKKYGCWTAIFKLGKRFLKRNFNILSTYMFVCSFFALKLHSRTKRKLVQRLLVKKVPSAPCFGSCVSFIIKPLIIWNYFHSPFFSVTFQKFSMHPFLLQKKRKRCYENIILI